VADDRDLGTLCSRLCEGAHSYIVGRIEELLSHFGEVPSHLIYDPAHDPRRQRGVP
jgi:hypothetical protein